METGKSKVESAPASLLVIEDDPRVSGSLARGLGEAGFEVRTAGRLAEAGAAMAGPPPALLILDLSLPDGDGLDWLRRIRREGHRQPVIILTARDAVADRVTGLEEGADDSLAKPFSFAELLARVRARLRSAAREAPSDVLRVSDLEVDRRHREVRRAGCLVELTAREFDVLACLAQWAGHPVSRDMLARDVWKVNRRLTPLDNVIDVHLSHLREKIDRGREEKLIRTVRGIGFTLAGDAP